jgi:hypothetical protein
MSSARTPDDVGAPSRLHIVSRIGASLVGGYAFVWGFTTLGIALGIAAGMPYGEAQKLLFLLAFLVFLTCVCWAFAAEKPSRVWAVLAGGGVLMTGAAWVLARVLL